ncbi:unnamed protein product, partial [Adineta ricciae]
CVPTELTPVPSRTRRALSVPKIKFWEKSLLQPRKSKKSQKNTQKTSKSSKNSGGFALQPPISILTTVPDHARRALSVPIIKNCIGPFLTPQNHKKPLKIPQNHRKTRTDSSYNHLCRFRQLFQIKLNELYLFQSLKTVHIPPLPLKIAKSHKKTPKSSKNPGGFAVQPPISISTSVPDQARRALSVPIVQKLTICPFAPENPQKHAKSAQKRTFFETDSHSASFRVNQHWFQIELDELYRFHTSVFSFDPFMPEKNTSYHETCQMCIDKKNSFVDSSQPMGYFHK